jgi:hypothetical protein
LPKRYADLAAAGIPQRARSNAGSRDFNTSGHQSEQAAAATGAGGAITPPPSFNAQILSVHSVDELVAVRFEQSLNLKEMGEELIFPAYVLAIEGQARDQPALPGDDLPAGLDPPVGQIELLCAVSKAIFFLDQQSLEICAQLGSNSDASLSATFATSEPLLHRPISISDDSFLTRRL